jgi:hypothetical protein
MNGTPILIPDSDRGELRDHGPVGWGSTITIVDRQWWLNMKVDGKGALLYDIRAPEPKRRNLAKEHHDVVQRLFGQAVRDVGGGFPDYLVELARTEKDAPGCSELSARPT